MAHTKALGSTRLGRDSAAQRLGLKKNHGQTVKIGEILVRQRGTKYIPGDGIGRGKDDTLFALKEGVLQFYHKKKVGYNTKVRYATCLKIV